MTTNLQAQIRFGSLEKNRTIQKSQIFSKEKQENTQIFLKPSQEMKSRSEVTLKKKELITTPKVYQLRKSEKNYLPSQILVHSVHLLSGQYKVIAKRMITRDLIEEALSFFDDSYYSKFKELWNSGQLYCDTARIDLDYQLLKLNYQLLEGYEFLYFDETKVNDVMRQLLDLRIKKASSVYGFFGKVFVGVTPPLRSSYYPYCGNSRLLLNCTRLGLIMMQAWKCLPISKYRNGMGNKTKLNYGGLSKGEKYGIFAKNKQVKVVNVQQLQKHLRNSHIMVLDKSAQQQIKQRAYRYQEFSSHV